MFQSSILSRRKLFINFSRSLSSSSILSSTPRSTSIGFIGLGAMGREMASNLLTKSFLPSSSSIQSKNASSPQASFVIHDVSESSMTEFFDRHAHLYPTGTIITAPTPASVSKQASTIITMLPDSEVVKEVYLHPETGILSGIQSSSTPSPTLCIDSTTLDRSVAIEVSTTLSNSAQVNMLDAPVSGGVIGAKQATLSFMCGGDEKAFKTAETILNKMGKKTIYCGKSGSGLSAKLANNLLLAISMIGVSESMLFGLKLGLSPQTLTSIINTSSGECWSSKVNNPVPGSIPLPTPADSNYRAGFKSKLMLKDLTITQSVADQNQLNLPFLTLSNRIYNKVCNDEELKDLDFSVVYQWLKIANENLNSNSNQSEEKDSNN
ncbi:NAD binding domain of 6-phosphogluconate dehydrogenase-domain-containing protein [Melampsora americana]|nr:NAD binding domain of 6-phosphogluconate dehydrogenase-domain-containing protein [Melampsora americana]